MENSKHWEAREIKLGNVRVGKRKVVVFKALSDLPSIAEISADCGCTTLKWSDKDKALAVTFKAGKFPRHIVGAIQPFTKRIYVTFEDKSVDILTLTGTKIR